MKKILAQNDLTKSVIVNIVYTDCNPKYSYNSVNLILHNVIFRNIAITTETQSQIEIIEINDEQIADHTYTHNVIVIFPIRANNHRHIESTIYSNYNYKIEIDERMRTEYDADEIIYGEYMLCSTTGHFGASAFYTADRDKARTCMDYIANLTKLTKLKDTPVVGVSYDKKELKNLYDYPNKGYVAIYDNIVDSINESEGLWAYSISLDYNHYFISTNLQGRINYKLNAFYCQDKVIITDNHNGLKSIEESLVSSKNIFHEYDIVVVNQYNVLLPGVSNYQLLNELKSYGSKSSRPLQLSINFINKDKILGMSNVQYLSYGRNSSLQCYLSCASKDTHLRQTLRRLSVCINLLINSAINTADIKLKVDTAHTRILYVPYEKDNNIHNDTIHWFDEILGSIQLDSVNSLFDKYLGFLTASMPNTDADDILMRWFGSCTADLNKERESIIKSYNNLKAQAIQEYSQIKIYLKYNDISKKLPIPSIKLSEGLKHGANKAIAFGHKTKQINNIGINPIPTITDQDLYIDLLLRRSSDCNFVVGSYPITKLFDKSKNCINIDDKELRRKIIKDQKQGRGLDL